ncbi:MAG: hypothetical protein PF513_01310 [Tenericutes bacterium]|nr:hypothetical protein [Mycoplasmatota bacterium]
MKRLTILVLTFIFGLTMISCNDTQVDGEPTAGLESTDIIIPPLNNMGQLTSYKALITIRNSNLEVEKKITFFYKDGISLFYYTDFPYIYKEVNGEEKILVWMEKEYYAFDVPEFDMIHLFDFNSYGDKQVTERNPERYSVDNYSGLNMFVMHVTNDLISEMEFNYQIDSGEVMNVGIEFQDYNDAEFSYSGTSDVPTDRQKYFYSFYEYGYHVKITNIDLRLFGVNYIVKIARDVDYIRVFVSDWYYEINPNTKEVAVVTEGSHVIYSNDDFFRLNRDFHFTKEKVDLYIELYHNYLSIYSD